MRLHAGQTFSIQTTSVLRASATRNVPTSSGNTRRSAAPLVGAWAADLSLTNTATEARNVDFSTARKAVTTARWQGNYIALAPRANANSSLLNCHEIILIEEKRSATPDSPATRKKRESDVNLIGRIARGVL